MLLQSHEPLERRCRAGWSVSAVLIAAVVIVLASGFHLGVAANPGDEPAPKVESSSKKDEPLHFSGIIVDKETNQPIAGATVVVRRRILCSFEDRILQETRHTTDADGKYAFTIPPEQYASPYLDIELDVEHRDYAPRNGFGYSLAMTRKDLTLNERPFFERIELRPAKPITGRVETPDGQPAAGVVVMGYSSRTAMGGTGIEYGSFPRGPPRERPRPGRSTDQGYGAVV